MVYGRGRGHHGGGRRHWGGGSWGRQWPQAYPYYPSTYWPVDPVYRYPPRYYGQGYPIAFDGYPGRWNW